MKQILLSLALFFSLIASAQDYNAFLKTAEESIEKGNFRKARENATKALDLNAQGLEARWIRTRTFLTSNSSKTDFEKAISDLNFMIANGGESGKVYKTLGIAEGRLANDIFRFKKPKENQSFKDDQASVKIEQKQYYEEAIQHYKNSKNAYTKAAEIAADEKENTGYQIKEIDSKILEIETKIKELK